MEIPVVWLVASNTHSQQRVRRVRCSRGLTSPAVLMASIVDSVVQDSNSSGQEFSKANDWSKYYHSKKPHHTGTHDCKCTDHRFHSCGYSLLRPVMVPVFCLGGEELSSTLSRNTESYSLLTSTHHPLHLLQISNFIVFTLCAAPRVPPQVTHATTFYGNTRS